MSLLQGMPISSIVEHLGVRFVITLQPEPGQFYLERLLEVGKNVAEEVLREDVLGLAYFSCDDVQKGQPVVGWRETFSEGYNTDHCPVGRFGRSDIARVEQKIIAIAAEGRHKFLSDPAVQEGYGEENPIDETKQHSGLLITSTEPEESQPTEPL